MSTAFFETRKLSTFVKCSRCRHDRQKCERPDATQKCLRCARYQYVCDSGRASNRAQRSQKLVARQRKAPGERKTVASATVEVEDSVGDKSGAQEIPALKVESSSCGSSRSVSSDRSTPWSTPSFHKSLQLRHAESGQRLERRSGSFPWTSDIFNDSSHHPVSEVICGSLPSRQSRSATQYDLSDYPSGQDTSQLNRPVASTQPLSGLTNLRPSRHRSPSPFEDYLDIRIDRLWGNYKTFAAASSKGLGVSSLFGRTLSELFRQSRQMAENGDDLVADVRYACGAADAVMNRKLSEKTRARYLEAYHLYDASANCKYRRAVEEFARKIADDESPDVLPLYTATFLYYAAGACVRGSSDLLKATFAFKYFNQYTAWFPIRIKILPTPEGTWAADMLLANNDQDPGMRINALMFALGRARVEFDRQDGLC